MIQLKHYIAVSLILLLAALSNAQDGDYYLTHHDPPADLVDNINFSILQDQNGIIWIANRKGIIQYDGVNWQFIPTPSAIFSLTIDENNTVYGGGRNVIGKIAFDISNHLYFTPIFKDPSIDDVISSVSINDNVLFLSEDKLHVYNSSEDTTKLYLNESGFTFQGLFKYNDEFLISTDNNGLYKLSENFDEISSYPVFDSLSLKTGIHWISENAGDGKSTALIDDDGNIHLANGKNIKKITFEDDDYIKSSIPMEALWVTDSLLAISSLSGGVIFINPSTGSIVEIINYHTGLPDNQIYALFRDIDDGIWVAHDYGFTRIAPLMPFKSYGNFPGLEGNILSIAQFNDQIYAGTSLGVYYLDEVKDFQEIEFYVRKSESKPDQESAKQDQAQVQKNRSKPPPKNTAASEEDVDPEKKKKEKKGVFNFLKKKDKKKAKEEQEAEVTQDPEADDPSDDAKVQDLAEPVEDEKKQGFFNRLFTGQKDTEPGQVEWQRRTRQELLSIRRVFKKIEEIPAKTNILISAGDMLITGGLSGLHEITEGSTTEISDIPVRNAYYSEKNELLFASTFENEILSFSHELGDWVPADLLEGLEDYIFQITEQENSIWLVSADSLYRIELDEENLVDVDVFQINNPYFEETYAVNHDGSLFFVNSSGYYYYEPSERKILEAEGLKEVWGPAERLFVGGGKNVWMFNGKEWNTLGEQTFNHDNYEFLNVFPEIRQLYYSEKDDRFWIVTAQNKIYEVTPPENEAIPTKHSIYLKEIRQQNNILLPESRLNIQLENSSLTFSFIQPDYSGLMGIEYQYRLAGLSDIWSDWGQNNNIVTFSFLPAGAYALEFQTRDIFGKINSINPVEFKIIDPYWRRPWFYAIEVAVFAFLLLLSIQLNRANTRYRIVSRLLAFLTLILIIEFIQTIAEYKFETDTSPVIDFFIQVSIALVVLPFESLLRRAIFRSQNANTTFSALSTPKEDGNDKKTNQKPKKKLSIKKK